MNDVMPPEHRRPRHRWPERLSGLRAVLQAVQTIAILIRIWQNF